MKEAFEGYESLTCTVSANMSFDLQRHPRLVPVGSDRCRPSCVPVAYRYMI